MTTAILSLLVLVSALLTIRAEYRGPRIQFYVFKPLTVVLIILVALETKHATTQQYKSLIVAGLLCSLVGDVFLMWPRDRFVAGLVSFLVAHLFYIAAFAQGVRAWGVWWAAALAVYGASMLWLWWRGFGKLKAAVVVYVAAILLMAWAALSRWSGGGADGGGWAAAGASLFVASDSGLAWDRFGGEFRGAQALILSTYFTAQWLIAVST